MSSSSNRPRFTDSELESLRLWATPNFGADGSYEEEIEEEPEKPKDKYLTGQCLLKF